MSTVESPPSIVLAELVVEPRGKLRRAWDGCWWLYDSLVGLVSLVAGLALLAAVPVVQFVSLGYLLECVGRITRERSIRAGFIGVHQAARLGTIALATWLIVLPLRAVSSLVASAQLVAPGAPADLGWSIALSILTVLAVIHVSIAIYRGGGLRHFAWPAPVRTFKLVLRFITFGEPYQRAVNAVYQTLVDMRLGYFFWLGLRGFLGTLAWLLVPVTLLASGPKVPVLGFLGGFMLVFVVMYLPFLQARFAADNRVRSLFDLRGVRRRFTHAPWAFLFALLITLALSLPLNLLKIEWVPREAAWLPSLFFVAFNLPARWFTGWAMARAERRETPRFWLWRWLCRVLMLPVAAAYVLFVYGTQFTSWYGIGSLYEQHAFLLPVPFLGNQ
jgi:hypothetical protein